MADADTAAGADREFRLFECCGKPDGDDEADELFRRLSRSKGRAAVAAGLKNAQAWCGPAKLGLDGTCAAGPCNGRMVRRHVPPPEAGGGDG